MTSHSLLREYSHSRAVLVGVSRYEFLSPVPAAENSVRRMAEMLTGQLCKWPKNRVLVLENESSPGDLHDRLITAFQDVTDVALFYFVGHGQIASDDQLCLGLTRSRKEATRRAATSLRFPDVRQALLDSNARIKIVILDCCFSGVAARDGLAGFSDDIIEMTSGTGAYTMTASRAYNTAWYEDDPGISRPQTFFTKYLVDLIERGIPGGRAGLRLDAIFQELHSNLTSDNRPEPQKRAVNDAREFVFALNAAPSETIKDPERELELLKRKLAEANRELTRVRKQMVVTPESVSSINRERQDTIDNTEMNIDNTKAAELSAFDEAIRKLEAATPTDPIDKQGATALVGREPDINISSLRSRQGSRRGDGRKNIQDHARPARTLRIVISGLTVAACISVAAIFGRPIASTISHAVTTLSQNYEKSRSYYLAEMKFTGAKFLTGYDIGDAPVAGMNPGNPGIVAPGETIYYELSKDGRISTTFQVSDGDNSYLNSGIYIGVPDKSCGGSASVSYALYSNGHLLRRGNVSGNEYSNLHNIPIAGNSKLTISSALHASSDCSLDLFLSTPMLTAQKESG